MTKHYPYGSSTANRTIHCPAWRRISSEVPTPPASQAANEGTAMHKLFEDSLNDGMKYPEDSIGEWVAGIKISEDMAEKVTEALELHDTVADHHGFIAHSEVTMQHSDIIGGTADIVGFNQDKNVVAVGDLKTGDGVIVQAEGNSQLLFCAALAIRHFKLYNWVNDKTVFVLYIIQPSDRRDDPLDIWMTDLETVNRFWSEFEQSVSIAEYGESMPSAGSWCKFCAGAAVCPAKLGQASAALHIKPDSKAMHNLINGLNIVDAVEDWVRDIRKLAHEQLEAGVRLDGWKLVQKRATRKWGASDMAIRTALTEAGLERSDIIKESVSTPAQIEKICKKKDIDFSLLENYIIKQSTGTTIAHADDKREAVLPIGALADMARRIKN